ncbi:MAG: N-acetyl-alpha-D-glucosaminyl L-malate synthase BshA [Crocinitomicaceae bacterium]|nr:N-acetyl-alpha-D-glucosaminyl L-malate synthase BshA [Crocinitomicaceae bacterium]|tara:strand:+ start:354 stop:1490 length:1137 start_codon:yes stop_codon:yes gene_type:complete
MRIGIVLYPTFGGSGIVATELGKELAKKNHEIHFITYTEPVRLGELRKNIFYHEVTTSDYPLFKYTPYEQVLTSKLVDVVKFEKLDLLHVHYAIPHASAAYMAQQILADQNIKIPFITTLHGTDITLVGKDPSFEPVINFSINKSNMVTAVSESLKKDTNALFKIKNKIEVVPNFICINEYKLENNDFYKKRFAPNNEKIICHISNFRKVKRIEDVLLSFEIISREIDVKLILVGDGPERSVLEKISRASKFKNNIFFLGSLKSTKEVLNISDLFFLPSSTESFGLSALEAMACSVPVISTQTGGIPEVVINGESGFLSKIGDVEEMSRNAIDILSNENKLSLFKENALKQAMKYDVKQILPKYEKIYEECVNDYLSK